MKTLEFALQVNHAQQATLNCWLESLRWVWNEGLRLCQEFDRYSAWDKHSKSWTACCPRFGDEKIRWIKQEDTWIAAPYSPIATKRNPTRFFCPLPPAKEYRQPQLPNISEFSLAAAFAHKRHPDKPWLKAIPANFIRGVTQSLNTAWQRYKKGEMGEPRFKGKSHPLETLTNNDAKIIRRDGDRLKIPNLGWIKVRGLSKRWKDATICSLRLVRRASGWVAHLAGYTADDNKDKATPIQESAFPKPSQPLVGVALIGKGGLHHATDLKAQRVGNFSLKEAKKLERLQRKLARQEYLSNRWTRTKVAIGKLHEKIRLRRKNWNHKLSTFLVRTYATLVMQAIKPGAKRRPEPIPVNTDPPQWAENGATVRSLKNRTIADLGQGQFISFVKQKAIKAGREVVEVASDAKLFGTELAQKLREDFISSRGYDKCLSKLKRLKEGLSSSVQGEGEQSPYLPAGETTPTSSTSTRKQKNQGRSPKKAFRVKDTASSNGSEVLENTLTTEVASATHYQSHEELDSNSHREGYLNFSLEDKTKSGFEQPP